MTFADRYVGLLYRALNPVYARDPLSGRGAELYGGRFNPKGTPALYASLSPLTALREANQVGALQPVTLVAYDADVHPVFDGRDAKMLGAYGVTADDLASSTWRDEMLDRGLSRTQAFSRRLIGDGYAALLVPSFARGGSPADLNLVLWRWGARACEARSHRRREAIVVNIAGALELAHCEPDSHGKLPGRRRRESRVRRARGLLAATTARRGGRHGQ